MSADYTGGKPTEKPKNNAIRFMKPMKPDRPFLIGAIDTETIGLDGRLVLAQIYHETWDGQAKVYPKAKPLLRDLFDMDPDTLKNTIWFIHNIDYDLRYIFQSLKTWKGIYQFECRQRCPGKFYEIVVQSLTEKDRKGRPLVITRFRDSTAIYEGKLETFTKEFAPAYAKKDIGLGRGIVFNPLDPVHIEYAKFDVLGLVAAVAGFDDLVYEHYQVHIKGTGSSTAYAAWLRTLAEEAKFYRQAPQKEAFFRQCYYGGLVQMGAVHGLEYSSVWVFDINSSYPAAMRNGIPKGNARWTPKYVADKPGFYEVKCEVDLAYKMPILPQRIDHQLAWGRGAFTTFISSLEYEYALECGHKVEVIHGFYFPEGLDYRFNEFVDIAEKLRAAFKKTPTEVVAKRMQNSLYGRFGMKPDGEECVVSFDGAPDGFLAVIDEETALPVSDVYWKKVTREADYMMPHVSAWITAHARINIDRLTTAVGRDRVLYRDTDSMHVYGDPSGALPHVGTAYGLLKNEGQKFAIKYHAPKCYTYSDKDGIPHAVYKGIPAKLLEPDAGDPKELFRERIATLHAGRTLIVDYHSSTSLKTFWSGRKMFVMRTRASTAVESIYSHVIENGIFMARICNDNHLTF